MSLMKKIRGLVGAGLLGLLLMTGGCMMVPHHGAYAANEHHDGSAPPAYETPQVSENRLETESMDMHSSGGHHGMMSPDRPWGWLVGGGMVLMMVLVAL